MSIKNKWREWLGIGFIFVIVAAVFAPGWLFKKSLYAEDISSIYYPFKFLFYQMGQEGKLFFWDPYVFSGFSNLGAGYFYPPGFLFFLLHPDRALLYTCWLHIFLGAAFLFAYLRTQGLETYESVIGALLFALSGFMLSETRHVEILEIAAWLPFLFLCWDKRKDHPLYLTLGALTLGLMLLAGNPQMAYLAGLVLSLKAFWDFWSPENRKAEVVVSWLWIIIIALLLSAVQLMTNLPLMRLATRQCLQGVDFANTGSWAISKIMPFFFPALYPHMTSGGELDCYFATLGVIMAVIGMFIAGRRKWFWIFLLFFSLLAALGPKGGVNTLLSLIIPVHKLTRAPYRFLLFAGFALSVLAAYGFNGLKKANFKLALFWGVLVGGEIFLLSLNALPFRLVDYSRVPQEVALAKQKEAQTVYPARCLCLNADCYNHGIYWKLSEISGYYPLVPHYYMEYLWYSQNDRFPTQKDYQFITRFSSCLFTKVFSHQMELLNLKYVCFRPNADTLKVTQLRDSGRRFFLAGDFKEIPEAPKLLAAIQAPDFKPYSTVLYQQAPDFPNRQKVEGKIRLLSYRPDRIELEAENRFPNLLVLSEVDFPGWQAEVDGKKTPIYRADYIFRSIGLPPGKHRVIFSYRPVGLRQGLLVSLAGLFLLLGGYFIKRRRALSPQPPE